MSGGYVVHGEGNGQTAPIPIDEVTDVNGVRRLAVDAYLTGETTSFVGEINLDKANDEVVVAGVLDGDQADTTRPMFNVSAAGRMRSGAGILVSSANSTTTPLSASATFTGTAENILDYAQINVTYYATPSTAKASFYFEFSSDGTNWDISVPALVRDPTFVIPIPLINVGKFFRVRYVNDGGAAAIAALGLADTAGTPTNQTAFRLTTYLVAVATKEITRTIDQTIQGSDPVILTRSIGMGRTPAGLYTNTPGSGISVYNNTTTTLGAGATFTGGWESHIGYTTLAILINASHASATSGLKIQFSDTNTGSPTVRKELTFEYGSAVAGSGESFYLPITAASYFRVVYVNGGTAQTSMFLESRLEVTAGEPNNQPLAVTGITDTADSALVRAAIVAKNAAGTYANILRSNKGGLDVAVEALTVAQTSQVSVGTSSSRLDASPLARRRSVSVKSDPANTQQMCVGFSAGVSMTTGYRLAAGDALDLEIDDTVGIWAISNSGTQTICLLEVGDQ